jgi:hypothetical protein
MNADAEKKIKETISSFILGSINVADLSEDDHETGIVNSLFAVQLMTFLEKRSRSKWAWTTWTSRISNRSRPRPLCSERTAASRRNLSVGIQPLLVFSQATPAMENLLTDPQRPVIRNSRNSWTRTWSRSLKNGIEIKNIPIPLFR